MLVQQSTQPAQQLGRAGRDEYQSHSQIDFEVGTLVSKLQQTSHLIESQPLMKLISSFDFGLCYIRGDAPATALLLDASFRDECS